MPAIFITGGPNAWQIRYRPSMKGPVDHKYYDDLVDKLATATCATCGACELMGTANTMQSLTEALGLSLPRSANVPAYHAEKLMFARQAGKRIVEMVEEDLTTDKILTMKAIENALIVDLAIGGSTNSTLHLPAIARACGLELPLERFNDFNRCGFQIRRFATGTALLPPAVAPHYNRAEAEEGGGDADEPAQHGDGARHCVQCDADQGCQPGAPDNPREMLPDMRLVPSGCHQRR